MAAAVRVQAVPRMRVEDILQKHRELAVRISLALDPDFYTDAKTVQSLQNELNTLKERTEREEIQGLLKRHGVSDEVRVGLSVMIEQLQARRAEVDPEYEFPSTLLASAQRAPPARPSAQAGPSGTDRVQGSGRLLSDAERSGSPDGGLERASGPQRAPSSIRGARNEANASPSSLRTRLSLPNDCQTFDVVFLPFKSDRQMELPDNFPDRGLCAAQLCLQELGLVFEVKLPRQGVVKSYFDCQVRSFCEDNKIDLKSGINPQSPAELLAPAEFTIQKLMGHPFNKISNHLSTVSKRVLLIAPIYASLKGAINLPNIETPQLKHCCHVSRLEAAIQEEEGRCNARCPAELDTGSSSRFGAGRTLAQ